MDVFKTLLVDSPQVLADGTGLLVASNNLNDLDDASSARTNLGVAIGSDVQAHDADLDSWAGVTRASGFDTFAATPSSANLAGLVSDETGTGALVFATSPTLVTPTLGAATATSLTVNDNTTLGSSNSDTVTFNGRVASDLVPSTDNTFDLGVTGHEWRNLNIDGTANIDSLVADTADINGGTIDGTAIGATTPSTGVFTTLTTTGGTLLAQVASGGASVQIGPASGSSATSFIVRGPAGTARNIHFASGSSNRWSLQASSAAESGSDAGSNFSLSARADGGAFIDTPIAITRAAGGTMTLARPIAATAGLAVTGDISTTGSAGIGSAVSSSNKLRVGGTSTSSATTQGGFLVSVTINASATLGAYAVVGQLVTAASSFTLDTGRGFRAEAPLLGAGSAVTNYHAFEAPSNTNTHTLNTAFRGSNADASGRYNLYMDGTAQNYLAGNVGIGTTNPAAPLNIRKDGAGDIEIARFSNHNTGEHFLALEVNDDSNLVTYTSTGSSTGGHAFKTGNTERLRIDRFGDIGIGTTTPGSTLDVNGELRIGNTVNTVSPTSPDRTITMVIGGTTYYIHAKTTND
jgi:hypothetical protein